MTKAGRAMETMTETTFVEPTVPTNEVLYPKTETTTDSAGNDVETEVTSKLKRGHADAHQGCKCCQV